MVNEPSVFESLKCYCSVLSATMFEAYFLLLIIIKNIFILRFVFQVLGDIEIALSLEKEKDKKMAESVSRKVYWIHSYS